MTIRFVLATRNRGKIAEFNHLFAGVSEIEVLSLHDLGEVAEVIEDGATFEDNAKKKACQVARSCGLIALADDSGLEVDALNGEPGVYSARFAGDEADDAANNRKLLELLSDVPAERRKARFRCVLALAVPNGANTAEVHLERGVCEGQIGWAPRGRNGFGYDPLFIPQGQNLTMAELPAQEKNRISHRARATRQMREYIMGKYSR
jgi:XTP/dITP diphosphohydrolase